MDRSELARFLFTAEQYDSLAQLIATLARELPRLRVQVPRDQVSSYGVLSPAGRLDDEGALGGLSTGGRC